MSTKCTLFCSSIGYLSGRHHRDPNPNFNARFRRKIIKNAARIEPEHETRQTHTLTTTSHTQRHQLCRIKLELMRKNSRLQIYEYTLLKCYPVQHLQYFLDNNV